MRSLIYSAIAVIILLHVSSLFAYGQTDKRLKVELDSIYRIDQLYREILDSPQRKDSLTQLYKVSGESIDQLIFDKMFAADKSNVRRVKQILKLHGYPGKTLVGTPTNEAAWYVIQHSEDINRYFPMIKQAGVKGELPFTLVAMMEDRLLMQRGKEQIYGTQVRCEGKGCYVWPIVNPGQVNQRRKKAGFDSTMEENAKRLGVEYKVVPLPKRKR